MKLFIAILASLILFPLHAGGFITEIGGGVKIDRSSSYLENPLCKKALVIDPSYPDNPRGLGSGYSCGGDNPVFVGWPIAWEFDNGVKLGLFHKSQWFDGNGELHFTCICASYTIRWSRFK